MKRMRLIKIACIATALAAAGIVFLNSIYRVPVLMYHSIDGRHKETKLSVSPESFERQMAFLRTHRYNVVGLDTVARYLQKKEPIPPKTVAITFDDGFYNNYQYAYPILKKYGIPATVFMITDNIGKPGWLGMAELKEMADSGLITVGSHTVSHPWLPSLGTKALTRELVQSKETLERALGKEVDDLCYPMGAHDDRVERLSAQSGYHCAVATNPGKRAPSDDIFAIKRIKISRTSDNLFVFWLETSGYYLWYKEFGKE